MMVIFLCLIVATLELLNHPGELKTSSGTASRHHPSSQSRWILREANCAFFPFNISILLPVRKICTSRRCSYPEGRSIYSSYGDGILSSVERTEMRLLVPCTHEEVDTRLMVHVLDAAYVWGQTFQTHQTGGGGGSTTHCHHSGQLYRK